MAAGDGAGGGDDGAAPRDGGMLLAILAAAGEGNDDGVGQLGRRHQAVEGARAAGEGENIFELAGGVGGEERGAEGVVDLVDHLVDHLVGHGVEDARVDGGGIGACGEIGAADGSGVEVVVDEEDGGGGGHGEGVETGQELVEIFDRGRGQGPLGGGGFAPCGRRREAERLAQAVDDDQAVLLQDLGECVEGRGVAERQVGGELQGQVGSGMEGVQAAADGGDGLAAGDVKSAGADGLGLAGDGQRPLEGEEGGIGAGAGAEEGEAGGEVGGEDPGWEPVGAVKGRAVAFRRQLKLRGEEGGVLGVAGGEGGVDGVGGGRAADGIAKGEQGDGGVPVAVDGVGDGGERGAAGEEILEGAAGALRLGGGGGARGEREAGKIEAWHEMSFLKTGGGR